MEIHFSCITNDHHIYISFFTNEPITEITGAKLYSSRVYYKRSLKSVQHLKNKTKQSKTNKTKQKSKTNKQTNRNKSKQNKTTTY